MPSRFGRRSRSEAANRPLRWVSKKSKPHLGAASCVFARDCETRKSREMRVEGLSAPRMSVEDLLEPTETLGMYRGILSNEMNCDKVDTLEWSIAITSRLLLRRRNGRNARRPILEQKLRRLLGRWRAGAGVALGFAAWRRDAARRRVDRLAAAFGRLVALLSLIHI